MKRLPLWLALAIAVAGCGDRTKIDYLGKWSGSYNVSEITGPVVVKDKKRNDLKGFLQLYATSNRYELHLDGEQFGLIAGGTWTADKKGQVVLSPNSVKIDDGGGEDARNPNQAWIDAAILKAAYSRKLTLRLSKDKKTLRSVLVDVGPLVGEHVFTKDGSGR